MLLDNNIKTIPAIEFHTRSPEFDTFILHRQPDIEDAIAAADLLPHFFNESISTSSSSLIPLLEQFLNCSSHETCFTDFADEDKELYCNATKTNGPRDRCCDDLLGVEERDMELLSIVFNVYLMNIFGIIGIFSNILAAVVLSHPRISGTTTSNYLRFLAISDLTLCLLVSIFFIIDFGFMPDAVMNFYIRAVPYISVLPHVSRLNSILLVVAVTVERYIAVCHPLKAVRLCTLRNCRILIGVVFLFAFVANIPRFFFVEHVICFGSDANLMSEFFTSPWTSILYHGIFETLIYCIFPFATLIIFNILLLRSVRRSTSFIRTSKSAHERRSEDNQRQLTVMLVVVVAVFVVCQVPAVVYAVVVRPIIANDRTMRNNEIVIIIDHIRNFPVMLNSALNFWLYCAAGKKFREIFLVMFCIPSLRGRNYTGDASSTVLNSSSITNFQPALRKIVSNTQVGSSNAGTTTSKANKNQHSAKMTPESPPLILKGNNNDDETSTTRGDNSSQRALLNNKK